MLCMTAAYAVVRCPSVCLSVLLPVTSVCCIKTSNRILNFFHSLVYTILIFWRWRVGVWVEEQTKNQLADGTNQDSSLELKSATFKNMVEELPKHQDRGSCCVDLAKFM